MEQYFFLASIVNIGLVSGVFYRLGRLLKAMEDFEKKFKTLENKGCLNH